MTSEDLPNAEAIADQVHPDLPEDPSVFAERLHLFPHGCLVLDGGDGAAGYVIAHPWYLDRTPKLNTLLGRLPIMPSTFFVHDVALLPAVQGRGYAATAVGLLVGQARALSLPALSLVAVGASMAFWRRMGFEPRANRMAGDELGDYGAGACGMIRWLR